VCLCCGYRAWSRWTATDTECRLGDCRPSRTRCTVHMRGERHSNPVHPLVQEWHCTRSASSKVSCLPHCRSVRRLRVLFYFEFSSSRSLLVTSAKEVMFLPDFVCLSVYLCISKITRKVTDGSFWNFLGMSGMAKTTSDSIFGVIRKESWILDHFEIFVNIAFNGYKGNRCQTKYGAATWRTTWPWRRSAGSDCFLV